MFKEKYTTILSEIEFVLGSVSGDQVNRAIDEILTAKTIVAHGAGRVGMAIRGFGMRLGHLGFRAYTLGDSTVPGIASGDLLVIASGSGETQTIYDIAALGKKNGARLLAITGNAESRIGIMADTRIIMRAPSKTKAVEGFSSIQPMTTLNEQSLGLLLDTLVLLLMEKTSQGHSEMWSRHSNLE